MDRYVIHNIVEHIRTQPEFPFDVLDVTESLDDVLGYFGLCPQLEKMEKEEMTRELAKLALAGELAEMNRLVETGISCHLDRVMQRLHPYRHGCRERPSVSPSEFVKEVRLQ